MPTIKTKPRSGQARPTPRQGPAQKPVSGSHGYKPIENYGIIGDLHTIALVGMDGSIDWCCLPHFDSPSLFASLLDCQKGGFFKIAPARCTVEKQMYLPGTCVLVTRFLSPEGVGEVIDFMPIQQGEDAAGRFYQIIRRVRTVRGRLKFHVGCHTAFNYARAGHTVKIRPHGAIFSSGKENVGLTSSVKLKAAGKGVEGDFVLQAGEEITFILRRVDEKSLRKALDPGFDYQKSFEKTCVYWRNWLAQSRYTGRWPKIDPVPDRGRAAFVSPSTQTNGHALGEAASFSHHNAIMHEDTAIVADVEPLSNFGPRHYRDSRECGHPDMI